MSSLIDRMAEGPLRDFAQKQADFLPNLLSAVVILAIGLVVGWALRVVTARVLGVLKADGFLQRLGVAHALERGGIRDTPSHFIGRLAFWLVAAIFAIIALDTLSVPAVETFLERFFLYLPNVFIAAVILLIGSALANFLSTTAKIAAVNAGLKNAGVVAKGVNMSVILLALTMALEQLGIGHDTIIIAFAIAFGGIVFAASLALGLAGKDLAREFLLKELKGGEGEEKEQGKDEIQHL